MFDENGVHYRLTPRCILDFYIHETRQRMGLGKELYEYMLKVIILILILTNMLNSIYADKNIAFQFMQEENLTPIKIAIDRPSDKFLAFLFKHYNLKYMIPQNNKFVVFKGFFADGKFIKLLLIILRNE